MASFLEPEGLPPPAGFINGVALFILMKCFSILYVTLGASFAIRRQECLVICDYLIQFVHREVSVRSYVFVYHVALVADCITPFEPTCGVLRVASRDAQGAYFVHGEEFALRIVHREIFRYM